MTAAPPPIVLTLGHSNREWSDFARLLTENQAALLVDVRSMPASRRYPWFNRKEMIAALGGIGIGYHYLGDRLGGRPKDTVCYAGGAVDYAKVATTSAFREGLDELATLARAKRVCLVCSEKDPMDCHRAILIARHLAPKGFALQHVHSAEQTEPQEAFEARLLAIDEGGLLGRIKDRRALVQMAYNRRGRKMAFRA